MSSLSSFRDPGGVCFALEGKIYRAVTPENARLCDQFLESAPGCRLLEANQLVGTRKLTASQTEQLAQNPDAAKLLESFPAGTVYEHERVWFSSYPHEWAPEMLHAAGELTLQLAIESAEAGFGLKDATPYNVLLSDARPIFVDLLSFERREAGDPLWKPYGQFLRTFVLPLLANREWGLQLPDVFLSRRDGLQPEEVYRMCGRWQRLLPPCLGLVSLPVWLSKKGEKTSLYQPRMLADAEKARYIQQSLLRRLQRILSGVRPRGRPSNWSGYMQSNSYSNENFAVKEAFVREFLAEAKPENTLDVGANTGHFSRLAAESGSRVIAIDSDVACVGDIWRQASEQSQPILPLVVDFARPSPALGWRNGECASFLERAEGQFDAVLMLAVLHHLLVTERIPLSAVLEQAASLTKDWLLIEYVGPEDEMFRKIVRGRENLFTGVNPQFFEKAVGKHFQIVRSRALSGSDRRLYVLRKLKR